MTQAELDDLINNFDKNIILKIGQVDTILSHIASQEELLEILQIICDNSIYSYQTQICNGYITLKGGHRVGISGNAVIENGKVKNISYIYSLNFRIAKEVIGCSNKIIKDIIDLSNNTI